MKYKKSDVFTSLVGKVEVPKFKLPKKRVKNKKIPKVLNVGPRIKNEPTAPLKAKNYQSYIGSNRWFRRRLSYFKKYGRQCVICGDKYIHVHHVTYENLGQEKDEDLVMLCDIHHERLHELVKTKHNMRKETYQFIRDEIEAHELSLIAKNL